MSMYKLPKFEVPKLKAPKLSFQKIGQSYLFWVLFLTIFISSLFGFLAGIIASNYSYLEIKDYISKLNFQFLEPKTDQQDSTYVPYTFQEEAIIEAVGENANAVVSIVVTKDVPVLEEYYIYPFEPFFEFRIPQYRQKGVEKQEVGGGTGFFVSEDGLLLTNKHVVLDEKADYTVFTTDGEKFPAKVVAKDPVQDLAILQIEGNEIQKPLPVVKLGDSDNLQIGQTVIAIGNALGEFKNTVSVGVISGLGRQITASSEGLIETLEDVIQTDAAINKGNSGGPLLSLKGEVIGVNTAVALEAENIGFAIPINKARRDIEQVKTLGRIVYPFLGVRYVLITESLQKENNLPVDYGAWLVKGESGEPAVFPGSVAEEIGLKEGDIILEFNGEKITTDNTLAKIIMKYSPGDKVTLKVLRDSQDKVFEVTLGERSE